MQEIIKKGEPHNNSFHQANLLIINWEKEEKKTGANLQPTRNLN